MSARPALLITGAARRVGAFLALYFSGRGYDIGLHYNTSGKDAEALKQQIAAAGGACHLFRHDMQDIKGIPAFMEQVQRSMPHLSALINNASVFERGTFMETDEALFDRQLDTNFKAPFFLTQAFAITFGRGCVINMLDSEITQTQGSHFAYLLSKKVLADFTQMAACQLGPEIRVNGVCPGVVLPANEKDRQYQQKLLESSPLKQAPTLEELADAIRTLIEQPEAAGQLVYVDGGRHAV